MSVPKDQKNAQKKAQSLNLPRIEFKNHELIIEELCDIAMARSQEEEVLHFLEWIKNKYLTKVREEHPEATRKRLNWIEWCGRDAWET